MMTNKFPTFVSEIQLWEISAWGSLKVLTGRRVKKSPKVLKCKGFHSVFLK